MKTCSVFLVLLCVSTSAFGGHVLVFPGEYSHWLNIRTIVDELVRRNHSVTLLVADASPSVNYNNSLDAAKFNFLVYKVPFSRSEFHQLTENLVHFSMYEYHAASYLERFRKMHAWTQAFLGYGLKQCESMLRNKQLMATLRDAAFHAVLLDPMAMCGDLVADVLGLPLIISLRFSFGAVLERHCGHVPAPPSYVPPPPLPYSDRMSFTERLVSVLTYAFTSAVTKLVWSWTLDGFYSEIKGSPSTMCETLGRADIWLMRNFWDMETPRPTLPNFKHVGGLHCKPAAPLPEDLEAFVQSSGEAGVVVVTFGSMVTNLTSERAEVFAAAFGRLPQKVVWRYRGEPPKALSANTKLLKWIPQNDLLGHPKTRAFVTHGGANGLYEALFHAVPLVGIPLFGDQPDNLARLVRLGIAVSLDFNHLTSDQLTEALDTVITQGSYRASMRRLSRIHRDQPATPLDTAVYWVEFVMRHGGAHLRPASHHLNWFQYHSMDVAGALLLLLLAAAVLCRAGVRCLLRGCRRQRRPKRDCQTNNKI
uniref:UDP-glucuronosyltransferase n=1 Tax=Tetraodon nigroviridis TaxID=99883 RepID=H3C1S8_TETNG